MDSQVSSVQKNNMLLAMPISCGKGQMWRTRSPWQGLKGSLKGAFLSACVVGLVLAMTILEASGAKLSPDRGLRRGAGDGVIAESFREFAGGHGSEMREFVQGSSGRGSFGQEGAGGVRGRRAVEVSPVNGPMSGQSAVMNDLALKSSTGEKTCPNYN